MKKEIIIFTLLTLLLSISLFGQESQIDLNDYYRFPLSLGLEYQSLSAFRTYPVDMNIYDISGNLRIPLPFLPAIQPMIEGGLIFFESRNLIEPEKLNHYHIFGAGGIVYSNRFAKSFEISLELLGGYSQSYFKNLIDGYDTVGSPNLIAQLGLRIGLVPSYNFTIDIHPNLKYLHSLGPLEDFNGFLIGLGFSAQYRIGEDPDAALGLIRYIRFGKITIQPVFAALQSYYSKNSLSSIPLTNTVSHKITNVQVSFYQAGFMDAATPSAFIPEILPGETLEAEIYASYNEEIFTTEGITPLTGEIIVSYESKGRQIEQRHNVSYDLHDKTAIVWNDNRKAAAFITPADSALRNYTSFIRQAVKESEVPGINWELQFAIQVYHALTEIGIMYQADPSLPFAKVHENTMIVDSINFPRDTLKRITGDCDDLAVLFCSLLETVGIETAVITTPGHIFMAFNTKIDSKSYASIHPEREMSISIQGELWIPIEITLIGKSDFQIAWESGIEEYRVYDNDPTHRGFYKTKAAQKIYQPASLRQGDLGLQYGNIKNIINGFTKEIKKIERTIIQNFENTALNNNNKEDFNTLGINYAQFHQYSKAEEAFSKALSIDPDYLQARINMANLYYLRGDFRKAAISYHIVKNELDKKRPKKKDLDFKVLVNLSKAYYKLKDYPKAKECYIEAADIDNTRIEKYAYLNIHNGQDNRSIMYNNEPEGMLYADEWDD